MAINRIRIPFNKPSLVGKELMYIKKAVKSGKISGDGEFSKKCTDLLKRKFKANHILLTPSCTAALDMTALLCNLKQGEEVIVPSFTFPSTVNAFVLRGAQPRFADIRKDTLTIDEKKIEELITPHTRAIYCVHYAGIACGMDAIKKIAQKHKLFLVEDAAHGVNAKYKDKYLGTIGDFGTYSFHETKSFNCGEGGALVINNSQFIKRAEIVREKGTNRAQFFRGEINKYTWCDVGSSYLLSEVLAAYLYAQLENMDKIVMRRKKLFSYYMHTFSDLEKGGKLQLPVIPKHCTPNYLIFFVLLATRKERDRVMKAMKRKGILTVFHYLPLHTSPMGKRYKYAKGQYPITENVADRLLRLPLYNDLSEKNLEYVSKQFKKLI